jgi:hypothetical protein
VTANDSWLLYPKVKSKAAPVTWVHTANTVMCGCDGPPVEVEWRSREMLVPEASAAVAYPPPAQTSRSASAAPARLAFISPYLLCALGVQPQNR